MMTLRLLVQRVCSRKPDLDPPPHMPGVVQIGADQAAEDDRETP